ncbi:hypothetical protein [Novosphingobium olei]|uniref:hypothetical protein n=1 Tax=Novosphingobium olei TaxID=2728851 RepID=UPI003086AB89|nr:hypothetical protein NSDW_00750 [Novosphingobium olei]
MPGLMPFLLAVTVFVAVGSVSGLLNGQQPSDLGRIALPAVLYMATAYATTRVVMTCDPAALRRLLAVAALAYVISGFVVQRLVNGPIDFETVRFQILGGATIPAIGYLECMALFGLTLTEIGAMGSAFVLLFLSITRTYLMSAAVQLAPLAAGANRLIGPRLIAAIVVVSIFGVGFLVYGGEGVTRWTDRLYTQRTSSGEDYTLYTRQSEWDFMIKHFEETTQTLVSGNGFAAVTTYYYPREVGGGSENSIGFGHSQHLSLLFIAGIAGGGTLLAVQFWQFFNAVMLLIRLARSKFDGSDLLFLAAWGSSIIIGCIVANFFSSIFNSRGWSLWYGVGTGLFIGARARYLRELGMGLVHVVSTPGPVEPARGESRPNVPPAVARRRASLAQLQHSPNR